MSAPNFCAWMKARAVSAWPGDAGRKAEVVLDPGAGAGLPAVGARIENDDRQAFGGGVDRGREARRPGADHGDVIDEIPRAARRSCPICRASARSRWDCAAPSRRGRRPAASRRRYRRVAGDQVAALPGRWRDRADDADSRCGGESPRAGSRRPTPRAPDQHRPAGAAWIRPTRRRMSARMMRSPRSASATSRERSPSGGISRVSTSPSAVAVDQRRAVGELADFGEELARALLDDRRHMAEAVALGDRDMALEHDEHAGRRACRSRTVSRRRRSCATRRSGAAGRSPARSASGRSRRSAGRAPGS